MSCAASRNPRMRLVGSELCRLPRTRLLATLVNEGSPKLRMVSRGSRRGLCSGHRRRVPQYGGHHNVPVSPRGHLVAHPLHSEQPSARYLLRQRNRVAVRVHGILGAVYDERRGAHLPESLPPTIPRVDVGMVGNARGEVGRAIEGAGCDLAYGRLVEGSRARKRTLAFDYVVDHGLPI